MNNKEEIFGAEYLEFIDPSTLEKIKKRGYEIISIMDGFQVWIREIDTDDEEVGFGEDVDEAIYNALPIYIKGVDIKEVVNKEVRV